MKYLFLLLCGTIAYAQGSSSWLSASASLGLSSDYYTQSGLEQARYPSVVHRATLRASATLFGQIELPFEAYVSSNDAGYRQPFNQFGINPRIGSWLRLHAGYFSLRMSEFSFGDTRLLGGGVELTPGSFHLAAFYGYARQARNPDSAQGFHGEYKRRVMGMNIGSGSDAGMNFRLNLLHVQDDSSSIQADTLTPAPQENLVTSLSFALPLFENMLRLSGELALGAFTANTRAPLLDSNSRNELQEQLYTANISTNLDGAARAGITFTPSSLWNLRAEAQWVGPGFVTLGYAQIPNDILDLTLSPSLRLFESRLYLRGSIGKRTNNLRATRTAATDRTIASLSLSAQLWENVGLDAQYSNYGIRSAHRNDTIRVENIARFFSCTPHANFEGFGGMNVLSLSLSYQQSEDKNQFSANATNNTTSSAAFVYSLSFPSTLGFTSSALYNSIRNSFQNLSIVTLNQSVSHSFFERLLSCSASAGVNMLAAQEKSLQFTGRLSLSLNLNAWGSFSLQAMTNNYSVDSFSKQAAYSELQGGIQYTLSL